jgi:hypothetical protein
MNNKLIDVDDGLDNNDDLDNNDPECGNLEHTEWFRELTQYVDALPGMSDEREVEYNRKMAFLNELHEECFGKAEPVEWEHDSSVDTRYSEPYQMGKM